MVKRIGQVLMFFVMAGGALLALRVTGVFAHAEYERSTPTKDEVLAAAPAQVDVYFSQEITRQEGANFVRVFNDQNAQVSDGDGVIDDNDRTHITATLQGGLLDGRYIVRWKSLSDADGDDDEGAFCFYVVVQPTPEQAAECAAFDEAEPTAAATSGDGETPGATEAEATAVEATPTAITTPDDDDDSSNTGVIVGIIVAVAAVVVVAGGGALYMRQRQQG